MFIDLRTYFKALYITFFKRRPSVRRWFFVFVFNGLFWVFWWSVAFGRMMDHVLFPGFRKQPVERPIFIIANPRSGTTHLHRLMCMDDDRFTYVRLYQTILPSIFHHKLFALLGRIDRRTGRVLSRLLTWIEKRSFGGWDGIHPMGFDRAEEDEGFFIFTLLTAGLYLMFPYIDELDRARFADRLPERTRRRLMRYYKSCLQRHLYANGRDKLLLSKNVLFCGRIQSILESFPEARIVYLVRHPYEAVPSLVSMFYTAWHAHSRDIPKDSEASRAFARLAAEFYKHMRATYDSFEQTRYVEIRYNDLVDDPVGTVERVYDHFGLEIGPEFRERLEESAVRSRNYESKHHYSLEEFGLSKEMLRTELEEILDLYDFEK